MPISNPRQNIRWRAQAGAAAMVDAAVARVLASAESAIRERGCFTIVLAGGSTPRDVYAALRQSHAHWPHWHVYFGDERCAPRDDVERNSRMAASAWLDHVAIPVAHVHPMAAELGPDDGAARYMALLAHVGTFDLVLLGLGEDGHTASLFPGHPMGAEIDAPDALAVRGAPKQPPERVTLSARRLSATRAAVFLVTGEGKRDAVAQWRSGAPIPAACITPQAGVDVLVDRQLLTP